MDRKRTILRFLRYARKIVYLVSLILLVGWLLERTYCIFQEYLSNPTYTQTVILPQYQAAIPAVTICPMYNGYKKDMLEV